MWKLNKKYEYKAINNFSMCNESLYVCMVPGDTSMGGPGSIPLYIRVRNVSASDAYTPAARVRLKCTVAPTEAKVLALMVIIIASSNVMSVCILLILKFMADNLNFASTLAWRHFFGGIFLRCLGNGNEKDGRWWHTKKQMQSWHYNTIFCRGVNVTKTARESKC